MFCWKFMSNYVSPYHHSLKKDCLGLPIFFETHCSALENKPILHRLISRNISPISTFQNIYIYIYIYDSTIQKYVYICNSISPKKMKILLYVDINLQDLEMDLHFRNYSDKFESFFFF